MRRILVMLMLLMARPALAQTHPCDVVPPTNPTQASPLKFGFCMPQVEAQRATAYKVYLDGGATPVFNAALTPIGSPNSGGMVYLETPAITIGQGSHSAQASAINAAGEGAKSAPYPFVVIGPPVAPSNVRTVP